MKAYRWLPIVLLAGVAGCGGGGSGDISGGGLANPSPVATNSTLDGTFGALTVTEPATGTGGNVVTVQPITASGVGTLALGAGTNLAFNGTTLSSTAVAASTGSFDLNSSNRTVSLNEGTNTSVSGFVSSTNNTVVANLTNAAGSSFPFQILSRLNAGPTQAAVAITFNVTEGVFSSTTTDLGRGTLTLSGTGVASGSVTNVTNADTTSSFTGGTLTVNSDSSISGTLTQGFTTPATWTVSGFLGQDGSVLLSLSDTTDNLSGFVFATPPPLTAASNASLSGSLQVETPVTAEAAVSNGTLTFNGTGTITAGELLSANGLGASLTSGTYDVAANGSLTSLTYSLSNGFTITSVGATFDRDSAFMYGLFNNQLNDPFFEIIMQ